MREHNIGIALQRVVHLSEKLGMPGIIAIEKGKFVPSVKLALELCRALQTPMQELFWLESEKWS